MLAAGPIVCMNQLGKVASGGPVLNRQAFTIKGMEKWKSWTALAPNLGWMMALLSSQQERALLAKRHRQQATDGALSWPMA